MKPTLSIVIPARNAAGTLAQQMEAVLAQSTDVPFEVLLAVQESDDDTVMLAGEYARDPRVSIVDATQRLGAGYARNLAVAAASGTWIAFCDADDVADRGWLANLYDATSDAEIVAGSMLLFDGDLDLRTISSADAVLPSDESDEYNFLPTVYTCSSAVLRTAFLDIGGFDLKLHRSHDVDLFWRLQLAGCRLRYARGAVMFKRERATATQTWVQHYRWGRYHPALYRKFADFGMTSDVRGALRDWRHLAGSAARPMKHPWSSWRDMLGMRVGRAVGSVLERRLYL